MELLSGIFNWYSKYSGSGILMVLFFVTLIYVALAEKNRSNRTVLLHGSIVYVVIIFCPITYYIYTNYVDAYTYWRLFWIMPIGIGLAYVGTKLTDKHVKTGLLMILVVLILGGSLVYTVLPQYRKAPNDYQLPEEAIVIADYLESRELDEIRIAVSPELLTYIRQYDTNIKMPYGREQLDTGWSEKSGFYELMSDSSINYRAIGEKCLYNHTRFIAVNNEKQALNAPENCGFKYILTAGPFDLYEYMELED